MKRGNVKDLSEEKYKTFLKGILLDAKFKYSKDVIVSVIPLKIAGFVFANFSLRSTYILKK